MTDQFFERPILNSPYAYPAKHWELDPDGQPTNRIIDTRRRSDLITPVRKPKKRRQGRGQAQMVFDAGDGLSSEAQEYNPTPIINEVRTYVAAWRALPNPDQWLVTPETARLLKHLRGHNFEGIKPFFCQIEAVETAIWLTEVAPELGARSAKFWNHLKGANEQANPELMRLSLKLATGAGKTTVMAMLIAWQAVNTARHGNSKIFSRGFLIVAPGITIRDRLRVLIPNDPESYYRHRDIVPPDMLADIDKAKIVITNYHAFKLRERMDVAKGTRAAVEGWRAEKLQTRETEGQMLQRVMPALMGMKNVVVLDDDPRRCHINWVVCNSDWEAEFCRVAEAHPKVRSYVKNQNLGLEVPYLDGSKPRRYVPDFIVQVNDGKADPLNLIVEIKGFRGENAKEKANTMRAYWVPGVNNLGKLGRWAFAEFISVYEIEAQFGKMIDGIAAPATNPVLKPAEA